MENLKYNYSNEEKIQAAFTLFKYPGVTIYVTQNAPFHHDGEIKENLFKNQNRMKEMRTQFMVICDHGIPMKLKEIYGDCKINLALQIKMLSDKAFSL